MKQILGCKNPPNDYSIGLELLNSALRPYLLAASYINVGIREADRITTLYPSGDIEISDLSGTVLLNTKPRYPVLSSALQDMRQFYRES